MPTRKIIAIGAHSNLTEATIFNGSEVIEYLKQRDWHLLSESFVKVAQDEYCLVDNSSITPDMNVVDEQCTRERIAAKTAGLKELRKRRSHTINMSMIPTAGIAMMLTYLMVPLKILDHMNTLTFIMAFVFVFSLLGTAVIAVIDLKGGCRD